MFELIYPFAVTVVVVEGLMGLFVVAARLLSTRGSL